MNIYCVIFMCTFGSNNTDTEISSHNSLTNSKSAITTGLGNVKNGNVASMILPERGEPVPQFGDIVMDLPDISNKNNSTRQTNAKSQSGHGSRTKSSIPSATNHRGPLAEILLPPAPLKNGIKSS